MNVFWLIYIFAKYIIKKIYHNWNKNFQEVVKLLLGNEEVYG